MLVPVAPLSRACAGTLNQPITFTLPVWPGFKSHWVWITTGVGKLLVVLSVRLARVCAAPEITPIVSLPVLVAASDTTFAVDTVPTWAAACFSPAARKTGRRSRRSQERGRSGERRVGKECR